MTGLFYGWHGNFSSWDKALKKCGGYNSPDILEKVRNSVMAVKNGEAIYERDSVLFYDREYSFPLLSGLMWIAAQNVGKLNVLDFGGSLGSSYFQNILFLDSLSEVNWCIVEQQGFVKTGGENFEDANLHFFYTIEECLKSYQINVVLLSSVLQYLEKPLELLDKINSTGISFLIIDRTPFIKGKDRITIQKVNPKIYRGSYPCWFFNESEFRKHLNYSYELIAEFSSLDMANIYSEFKGFILRKKLGNRSENNAKSSN